MKPARIAVLFHEKTRARQLETYEIDIMAQCWREAGHRVDFLFGPYRSARADLCIVHVDVSVVPEPYVEFAQRFPVVLNGRIRDIRKSRTSRNLVTRDSGHDGPVIVKTDLNYAGLPERMLHRGRVTRFAQRLASPLYRCAGSMRTHDQYRVYDHVSRVPARYLEGNGYVVEKFVPQIVDGLYCVNCYKFFGDRYECGRSLSKNPIVLSGSTVRREYVEPDEAVVRYGREIGMDFGKIDYTVHRGKAEILDVNKTPGRLRRGSNVPIERVLHRAEAIRQYLE